MAGHTKHLSELLYMASVYRKHHYYDLAIKLLRELVEFEEHSKIPDRHCLAVGLYNLGEVYSDQGNYILAKPLYQKAAELWHSGYARDPLNMLWYSQSFQELQEETERLTELAHWYAQEKNGQVA